MRKPVNGVIPAWALGKSSYSFVIVSHTLKCGTPKKKSKPLREVGETTQLKRTSQALETV